MKKINVTGHNTEPPLLTSPLPSAAVMELVTNSQDDLLSYPVSAAFTQERFENPNTQFIPADCYLPTCLALSKIFKTLVRQDLPSQKLC